jgi:phosphohistidine swiveling domain-containing protein
MLQRLINSKTRLDILAFLFGHPDKKYYAGEIVKNLGLDPANAHKELLNLVQGEFLLSTVVGGKKYFSVNRDSIFFSGLSELISCHNAGDSSPTFFCLEEMPNYYPMMLTMPWNVHLANKFFAEMGITARFSALLNTYEDNLIKLFVPQQEFLAVGRALLEKVKNEDAWGDAYVSRLSVAESRLYQASEELNGLNLKRLSDRELFKVYDDYYRIYTALHVHHWVQTALDFGENVFSRYLMNHLKEKIVGTKYSLGDVFSILTTPTAEAKPAQEYRQLLLILADIMKSKSLCNYFSHTDTRLIVRDLAKRDAKLFAALQRHVTDFGWLGYGTVGPAWDMAYFVDILASLARQKANPTKLLQEISDNKRQIKSRQEELDKALQLDSAHRRIFKFARNLVFTKGTRKDSMFHSYASAENMFREIGRRRYLSLRQVRYLHPHEFKQVLLANNFPYAVLNERYKFGLNFSTGRYEDDINLTGAEAKKFIESLNIIEEDITNVKMLVGDCASPGRVRGAVKIINEVKDMAKMNKGDILISTATTPDLVPAIKKAAAIVTDVGGITCHAAIISRELGIPCVVGTKIATKVLHDGDIIDVNASHGKVDIIKRA